MHRKPVTPPQRRHARRQRGVTLIEALVALMLMGFGMVALVELMGNLRRSGDLGKQRNEAMRLAQEEMAGLRAFSMLAKPSGSPAGIKDYDNDLVTVDPRPASPGNTNVSYTVTRTVTDLLDDDEAARAKALNVTVTWYDRATRHDAAVLEAPQIVSLTSLVSRTDPAYAGAVGITPPSSGARQPSNRHPAIPQPAKDLGNRSSVYRPSALGSVVWIFNNVTGVVTGKCAIPAGTPVTALTAADVESCNNNTVGYLISGLIRFSYTDPANPATPEGGALPLGLEFAGGNYLTPELDRRGTPLKDADGNYIMKPAVATPPASYECFNDSPGVAGNQPFVTYDCVVYLDNATPRSWSGMLRLTGPRIGTTSADYRVCRYSADYNGNGSMYVSNTPNLYDNSEHPDVYVSVMGSLTRQNFLVVRGNVNCPTAPAVNPAAGVFVDYSTRQLQPAP